MAKKGLKPKDLERMNALIAMHPGEITDEEVKERQKLMDRWVKEGKYE